MEIIELDKAKTELQALCRNGLMAVDEQELRIFLNQVTTVWRGVYTLPSLTGQYPKGRVGHLLEQAKADFSSCAELAKKMIVVLEVNAEASLMIDEVAPLSDWAEELSGHVCFMWNYVETAEPVFRMYLFVTNC